MNENALGVLDGRVFFGQDDFVVWNCVTDGSGVFDGKYHFHDFYELSYLYAGEGSYEVNGLFFPAGAGFLLLTTPSDYHRLTTAPKSRLCYFNVIFRENLLDRRLTDRLYRSPAPLCLFLPEKAQPVFHADFERLHADYTAFASRPDAFSSLLVKNAIESLCLRFYTLLEKEDAIEKANYAAAGKETGTRGENPPERPKKPAAPSEERMSPEGKRPDPAQNKQGRTAKTGEKQKGLPEADEAGRAAGQEDEAIRAALLFIRENYRTPLSLARVAEAAGLSAGYFSSRFKQVMKIGFSEYLLRFRLTVAAGYVASSDLPLKAVAAMNGFRSTNYFSAAFSSYFGLSPRAYRRRHGRPAKEPQEKEP